MKMNKRNSQSEMRVLQIPMEPLEGRVLLSAVSVSTNAQLQSAIAGATAGTEIDIAAGNYSGFQLSASGTAGAPIVIKGETGAVINGTPADSNGEIDIAGCSYVTLENLDVQMGDSTATRAGIWGGGYAGANVTGITVTGCTVANSDWWNVLFGFTNNSTFSDNTLNGTLVQHDLYVGNSSNDDTIQGNLLENAEGCGLEINEDVTQGGTGYGSGFVVDGNTFYNDAQSIGADINFDGVQNSIIENNIINAGQRNGIALYQINGALPSTGNVIVNNTIDINSVGSAGYAAISLVDGSANTTIYNNILSSDEDSLSIDPASQVGLKSDYNVFATSGIDPTGQDYYDSVSLSAWQAMGYDQHSLNAGSNIAGLFVNAAGGSAANFNLAAGSMAVGAGTSTDAPLLDFAGNARPTSGRYDAGALQYQGTPPTSTSNPTPQSPTAEANSYTVSENGTLTIASPGVLANDTDPNAGQTLTAKLVTGPSNVSAFALNANGSFSLTPAANYTGAITFTYDAADALASSSPATVTVDVTPVVVATPPASGQTDSMFSSSAKPISGADPDSSNVTLGVKFTSSVAGTITGVEFYKEPGQAGTNIGGLWNANGALLASGTFVGETASGWQTLLFSSPIAIQANTVYTVGVYEPGGGYADDQRYFRREVANGPLTVLANGGVYSYGSSLSDPTSTWNSSNYWVSPIFVA